MKRRKKSSTPIFIDLTLDESSEEKEVVDQRTENSGNAGFRFINLTLEEDDSVEEKPIISSVVPTPIEKVPIRKIRFVSHAEIRVTEDLEKNPLRKFRRELFSTISPSELSLYVGGERETWERMYKSSRIKRMIERTSSKLINSKHPLFQCLEGNTFQFLKEIFRKYISTSLPESISKDGMICELIRKFFGVETAFQKREVESKILSESGGDLEMMYRFVTVCGCLLPNEMINHILSYLPRNYDLLVTVGSVCSTFYVLCLCSWKEVTLTTENCTNIPLTVLQRITKLTLQDLTLPEIKYVFEKLNPKKFKVLRIDGSKFSFRVDSVFGLLHNLKKSNFPNDHLIRVMNNITKIELPGVWFYYYSKDSIIGRQVKDIFPNVRSVGSISKKLTKHIFEGCRIEDVEFDGLGMSTESFGRDGMRSTWNFSGSDNFLFDDTGKISFFALYVKKLIVSGYVMKHEIMKKVVYSLKNLEEVCLFPSPSAPKPGVPSELGEFYSMRHPRKKLKKLDLSVFDRMNLEMEGMKKLRSITIKLHAYVEMKFDQCLLELEQFSIIVDNESWRESSNGKSNIGFLEMLENKNSSFFLVVHQIRKLKMIIPLSSLRREEEEITGPTGRYQKVMENFNTLVCKNMMMDYNSFDLTILFGERHSSSFRLQFDRNLICANNRRITSFRITLSSSSSSSNIRVSRNEDSELTSRDIRKRKFSWGEEGEFSMGLFFKVLLVGIVDSAWMKKQVLDYLEFCDFVGGKNKWFLEGLNTTRNAKEYKYVEDVSERSCCYVRRSLL